MKKLSFVVGLLMLAGELLAGPTALEIIKKMDALQNGDNQVIVGNCLIHDH